MSATDRPPGRSNNVPSMAAPATQYQRPPAPSVRIGRPALAWVRHPSAPAPCAPDRRPATSAAHGEGPPRSQQFPWARLPPARVPRGTFGGVFGTRPGDLACSRWYISRGFWNVAPQPDLKKDRSHTGGLPARCSPVGPPSGSAAFTFCAGTGFMYTPPAWKGPTVHW